MIRCPAGHWFTGPIESLTCQRRPQHDPGAAAAAPSATRGGLTTGPDGRDGSGRLAAREAASQPGRDIPRRHGTPAYYLGRPARLWITALRPRRGHAASHHLIEAVTGR